MVDSPDEALSWLVEGNERYAHARLERPNQGADRRSELVLGQKPFATILGCSDSRVPAELVFDRGLGDLFVVRTAGHVVDRAVLGSVQYGVKELRIPLILVLGHEGCGAVHAAVDAVEKGTSATDEIAFLVQRIRPAVVKERRRPGDPVDNAVRANALMVAERLRADVVMSRALKAGALRVEAARYDSCTGRVELLT